MAILSIGKPTIEIAELDKDGNKGPWIQIDTPKDGTTSLETSEGDSADYNEEGGALVDRYVKQSTYTLTLELFAKKGFSKPIPDKNGVVTKNYAIRLTPEDPECKGFIMHKCSVSCLDSFTVADGMSWVYNFAGLVSDETEEILDEYIKANSFDFSANYVVLPKAGTSQSVDADEGAGASLEAEASADWITPSVDDLKVSVSASENTSGVRRVGVVTVTSNDGKTGTFKVIQKG